MPVAYKRKPRRKPAASRLRALPECWACGKECPTGNCLKWAPGWVSRPLPTKPNVMELYCPTCFREWGWPVDVPYPHQESRTWCSVAFANPPWPVRMPPTGTVRGRGRRGRGLTADNWRDEGRQS